MLSIVSDGELWSGICFTFNSYVKDFTINKCIDLVLEVEYLGITYVSMIVCYWLDLGLYKGYHNYILVLLNTIWRDKWTPICLQLFYSLLACKLYFMNFSISFLYSSIQLSIFSHSTNIHYHISFILNWYNL